MLRLQSRLSSLCTSAKCHLSEAIPTKFSHGYHLPNGVLRQYSTQPTHTDTRSKIKKLMVANRGKNNHSDSIINKSFHLKVD